MRPQLRGRDPFGEFSLGRVWVEFRLDRERQGAREKGVHERASPSVPLRYQLEASARKGLANASGWYATGARTIYSLFRPSEQTRLEAPLYAGTISASGDPIRLERIAPAF